MLLGWRLWRGEKPQKKILTKVKKRKRSDYYRTAQTSGDIAKGDIVTEREGFFRYTLSIKKQGMQK